jgi:hypothetical protein
VVCLKIYSIGIWIWIWLRLRIGIWIGLRIFCVVVLLESLRLAC